MNLFLEPSLFLETLLKTNFFLDIFQGFCLKVSEDFFHRSPPCIFVLKVNCARSFYDNPEIC